MRRRGISSRQTAALGIVAFLLAGASLVINRTPVVLRDVTSINGLAGAITLAATSPITVSTGATTITYACPTCIVSGGGGFVSSVSNSDGTLTISPTTGAVIASLNLAAQNTWTGATQTFKNIATSADATYLIGTATNRFSNVISNLFSVYHASGDGNPTAQLLDFCSAYGGGGGGALDTATCRRDTHDLALRALTGTTSLNLDINEPTNCSQGVACFAERIVNFGTVAGPNTEWLDTRFTGSEWDISTAWQGSGVARALALGVGPIVGGGTDLLKFNTDYTISFFGSSGGTLIFKTSTTGLANTQGFQSVIAQTLSAGTSTTINLPVAEPDTTYGVVCTLNNATPIALSISGQTTTQFVINYPAIVGAEKAHCIIWHQ